MLQIFEHIEEPYLVLTPDLHIIAASDAFLSAAHTRRTAIVGKHFLEAISDTLLQKSAATLYDSFQKVLKSRSTQRVPLLPQNTAPQITKLQECTNSHSWMAISKPVLNEQGDVQYILHKLSKTPKENISSGAANSERGRQLEFIIDALPVLISYIDKDLIYRFNNRAYEEWFPMHGKQLAGKPVREVIGETAYKKVIGYLKGALAGERQDYEAAMPYREDFIRHIRTSYVPDIKEGEVVGIYAIITDITEQAVAGQQLEESEEKYRSLFETMVQGFCIIELIFNANNVAIDYRFLEANPKFREYTGLNDAIGNTARQLLAEPDHRRFVQYGKVALTGEATRFTDISFLTGRWFDINAFRLGGNGSRKVAILFSDVTEQIQAQQALQESKERFSSIFNQSSVGIAQIDLTGKILLVNDRYTDILLRSKEELYQLRIQDITHPDDFGENVQLLDRLIHSGTPFSLEKRYIRSDGTIIWVNMDVATVKDAQGKPIYIIGMCQDITERKLAEANLHRTNQWYELVNKATQDTVWDWDLQTNQVTWNEGIRTMFNYAEEEVDSDANWWCEHIHPEDHERVVKGIGKTIDTGEDHWSAEYRFRTSDGDYRTVFDRGFVLHDHSGKPIRMLGSMQDITKRKQSEEALKRSEDLFRTFANNIQNLAWMAHPDGTVYWYNQRWYAYTGTSPEEMHSGGWKKIFHPEQASHLSAFWENACLLGETWEKDLQLRGSDGIYRWFLTRAFAVKDTTGKVVRWVGTNTDIDNQKQVEELLARNNRQLIKVNNDMDNFIYTASHDLKAPINNIEGLLYLLNNSLSEDNRNDRKVQAVIEMIHKSITKFQNTIKDLAEIAEVQNTVETDLEEVFFQDAFEEAKADISNQIEEADALIRTDFSQAPAVYLSKKNLRSILYNLVSNAVKYRSPERKAEVHLSTSQPDSNHILLTIQDNGLGIKEADQPKVFMMFKRLHKHVEGTGVGMAIVKKIVDNNEGRIEIESQEGQGSLFKIYLRTTNKHSQKPAS